MNSRTIRGPSPWAPANFHHNFSPFHTFQTNVLALGCHGCENVEWYPVRLRDDHLTIQWIWASFSDKGTDNTATNHHHVGCCHGCNFGTWAALRQELYRCGYGCSKWLSVVHGQSERLEASAVIFTPWNSCCNCKTSLPKDGMDDIVVWCCLLAGSEGLAGQTRTRKLCKYTILTIQTALLTHIELPESENLNDNSWNVGLRCLIS